MHRRGFLSGAAAAALAVPARARPEPLRLALLGQALIQHDLCAQDWPGRGPIAALLRRSDVVFTDLETALLVPGAGAPMRDPLLLHAAPPSVLDCLKSLGVSLVATANNHAWDLGTAGISSALPAIDAAGLVHAGTGPDLASAAAPAMQRSTKGRVALVAAATGAIREGAAATADRPGVNELRRDKGGALNGQDLARVLAQVRTARAAADVVVFYHHNHDWEPDNGVTPPWQRDLARAAIDAGASVFVSHGAPKLHGMEIYRGCPAFYDLGNFMFQTRTRDERYGPGSWESVVAECEFEGGRFRRAVLTPLVLNAEGAAGPEDFTTRGRPALANRAEAAAILTRLEVLSKPYSVNLRRDGSRGLLTP